MKSDPDERQFLGGFSGFFPKVLENRRFLGYLSSKKRKPLHCAQLIFSCISIGAQCNGPRFNGGIIPNSSENGGYFGSKNGSFCLEFLSGGLSKTGNPILPLFRYRETGSKNEKYTGVNHPPHRFFGGHFGPFFKHFCLKIIDFSFKTRRFLKAVGAK